jgi:ribosomal protein S18 acetylase RimI-like enzyme
MRRSAAMSPSPPQVRPARPSDAAAIADFNLRLALESEDLALDPATVRAGVEAVLADPGKGLYFVAVDGEQPLGQLMLTVEWSDWRNGPIYWLQSVYVVPARRRDGLFRALWEQALTTARAAGARAVRLYVEEENLAAQEVYRRVGMAPSGYLVFERQPV